MDSSSLFTSIYLFSELSQQPPCPMQIIDGEMMGTRIHKSSGRVWDRQWLDVQAPIDQIHVRNLRRPIERRKTRRAVRSTNPEQCAPLQALTMAHFAKHEVSLWVWSGYSNGYWDWVICMEYFVPIFGLGWRDKLTIMRCIVNRASNKKYSIVSRNSRHKSTQDC